MTCSTCGTEIRTGETVCSLCGTPVGPAPGPPGAPDRSRSDIVPLTPDEPAAAAPRSPFVEDQIQNLLRQGYIHLRRKNLTAATEACDGVFTLDKDDPLGHELKGLILEEEGDEMGAFREFRAACQHDPKPIEAETHMASLLLRMPPETLSRLQPSKVSADGQLPPEVEARIDPQFRAQLAAIRPAPAPKVRAAFPAFASLAIPGCGQWIKGEYGKAVVMFLVWIVCAIILASFIPERWQNHQNVPLNDPFLWGVVGVILVNYLVSILDAASSSGNLGP